MVKSAYVKGFGTTKKMKNKDREVECIPQKSEMIKPREQKMNGNSIPQIPIDKNRSKYLLNLGMVPKGQERQLEIQQKYDNALESNIKTKNLMINHE